MTFKFISSLLFLIFGISIGFADGSTFNIIEPKQKYISYEGFTSVVIEADSSQIDYIEVKNDTNLSKININNKKTHYCIKIQLTLGINNISITAYKDKQILKEKEVSVYFTSTILRKYKFPPLAYTERYFHANNNEYVCKQCHDMKVNEVKRIPFKSITDSNCFGCHKSITNKKHSHDLEINWQCTACHNGEVGRYNRREKGKSKYLVPDPVAKVCFNCHKKEKEKWAKKRFSHAPVDSGRCNKCHNSHSSDEEYYLKKSELELCVSCHRNKSSGEHIVNSFSEVSHEIENVKDPTRPGKNLSCVSCHDPHNSNTKSLILADSVMGLCIKCHDY